MKHWYHCDTPQLIDANELEVGDYVVGYKQFETDGILQSYNPELLGFWLSDGWSSNGTSFYIAKQDKELLEIFSPYIDNIRIKRHQSLKYKEEWVGTIVEPIKSEIKPFYNSSKYDPTRTYCRPSKFRRNDACPCRTNGRTSIFSYPAQTLQRPRLLLLSYCIQTDCGHGHDVPSRH